MLGVEPRPSPERQRLIAERERARGVAFPSSVVEWFALEDAADVFHDNSNHDSLVPLAQLGDPAEVRQGYLRVALENQAVVAFYVRLDEGDDSPVYDNNDEFLQEDLSRIAWNRLSVSFSTFVFDMVAVGRLHAHSRRLVMSADGPAPDEAQLERVGRRLRRGPVTRIEGQHEYLTVRWRPDGPAEWHAEADSPEALEELRRAVADVVPLAPRRETPLRRQGAVTRLLARLRGR
jgi:hypothetical protein